MTESSEIQQLREEIQNLRYLYKKLAETLIPEDKVMPDEAKALDEESKEYVSEKELVEKLRKKVRKEPQRSASD
jgi:hypothetical protein